MVVRALTGGTPDTAVAIFATLACNRRSVYRRSEGSFVREEKVRTTRGRSQGDRSIVVLLHSDKLGTANS
jgi:hypothetical protein